MTKFRIKLPVKVGIFILAVINSACAVNNAPDIRVTSPVEKTMQETTDNTLSAACRNWAPDSDAIKAVFTLGREYAEEPYSQFYQTPCDASGELTADGQQWHFSLNGGGIMTLTSGNKTLYRGCSDAQCAPYILLLTDAMSGE